MTQNKKFFDRKREWSTVKDNLLTYYLKPYFTKILATGKLIIYIDGFAGAGVFKDGQEGSPLLALKTFAETTEISHNLHKQAAVFYFIEIKKDLYACLQNNIDNFKYQHKELHGVVGYKVCHGNFRNELDDCLDFASNANVFLYLDPYGIKFYDFDILTQISQLKCYSFEVLCNFNSFGFFRSACRALKVTIRQSDTKYFDDELEDDVEDSPSIKNLDCAYGSEGWRKVVSSYIKKEIDATQAEKKIAEEIHSNLRKHFKYVLNMPIRVKSGNIPKYRMYHATNNIDGCILMAQNMQKRKDRLIFTIQGEQQESLFGDRYTYSEQGDMTDLWDVEDLFRTEVCKIQGEKQYKEFLAEFVTDHGIPCPFKNINEIMKKLEKEGKIVVRRIPEITKTGKPAKFWSETNKQQVFIRSK